MIDLPPNDVAAEDPVIQAITNAFFEAKHAKQERMLKNANNFNAYHMKKDWSHKKSGQSREFLPKQSIAVEQTTSFIQQSLLDINKWFEVRSFPGVPNPLISPEDMQKLMTRQLDKNKSAQFIADAVKLGLLGSLMIVKVHGEQVECPKYEINRDVPDKPLMRKAKPYWQLKLSLIRQEDWFPDPFGGNMYTVERIEMDYYKLIELAKQRPDIYDMDVIKNIPWGSGDDEEDHRMERQRETAQNVTYQAYRKRVVIREFWGTMVDPVTGEMLHENCVAAVANNRFLIRPPKQNPFWHQESPYVVSPIIRVPHSAWHKALMDEPTQLNFAQTELFNLMLDGGLQSVFGIRQLREEWLANPEQINEGIPPGTTLMASSSMPPGGKVLERVDTGSVPPEAMEIYNLIDKEFFAASLSNDTRVGAIPSRQVKATEIIASNNAISGTFKGISNVIEKEFISPLLDKSWKTMAQHANDFQVDEVKSLIGEAQALKLSNMDPKEIFAQSVGAYAYHVFGLSTVLNKMNDFQKITALLQTIAGSPVMSQEFQKKYSYSKMLGEIIKSLDIDEEKIQASPDEVAQAQQQAQQQQQMQAQAAAKSQGQNPMPDNQSQIPNVGNMSQSPFPRVSGITNPGR